MALHWWAACAPGASLFGGGGTLLTLKERALLQHMWPEVDKAVKITVVKQPAQLTFPRVHIAVYLHCFLACISGVLGFWYCNDNDLIQTGLEAGKKPAGARYVGFPHCQTAF